MLNTIQETIENFKRAFHLVDDSVNWNQIETLRGARKPNDKAHKLQSVRKLSKSDTVCLPESVATLQVSGTPFRHWFTLSKFN